MRLKAVLFVVLIVAVLFFLILAICFFLTFYSPKRKPILSDEFPLPKGEVYKPFKEVLNAWLKEVRAMPSEDFSVVSFDGLTLRAKYYELSETAPIEVLFPGYRGNAERDLCGAVQRCFAVGHSAFIVDQRAAGRSDGSVITFGINESCDVHTWLSLLTEKFPNNKIILAGVSMGGAVIPICCAGVTAICFIPRNGLVLLHSYNLKTARSQHQAYIIVSCVASLAIVG